MLEPRTNTELKVPELLSMIDSGESLLLLDVRNEDQHRRWPLEGRRPVKTIHITYFEFIEAAEASLAKVPAHPGPIAVLCAKGGSSELVAALLRETGRAAQNVAGGMVAYGEYLSPARVPLDKADITGLELWQINRRGKGCLSYLLRAGSQAILVDPPRPADFTRSLVKVLARRV